MVETEQWRYPFNDLHWIHHLILLYNRKIKKSIRCIFLMNNAMSIMIFFSSDSNHNLMNLVYYSHPSPSKTTRTRVLKPHKFFKAWESIISPNVNGGIMEKRKKEKKRQMYLFCHLLFVEIYFYSGKEKKKRNHKGNEINK